jgi:hypothetical protein
VLPFWTSLKISKAATNHQSFPVRINLNVPDGCEELALICDDPDAPTNEPFVHWLLYKLPPDTGEISQGMRPNERVELHGNVVFQGRNSFQKYGYGGPLPPKGDQPHHYHFRLYALDRPVDLESGATKADLLQQIEDHVVAYAEDVGEYQRQ